MLSLREQTFEVISDLMHKSIGLHFTPAKQQLVCSRLAPRLRRLGLHSFEDYADLLMNSGKDAEFQMAVDLLTTNETYFFRESAHFDAIEQALMCTTVAVPRVWSAACSYGDEAYSVAMLLADMQARGQIPAAWSVLGTDISDRVLRHAIEGIYPQDRLRHVSAERVRRHCLKAPCGDKDLLQVAPSLRERVRFGQLNLCHAAAGLGPFDVVMLRNVLIYFDADTRLLVIEHVLQQLKPGGLFIVGTADGRLCCDTPLQSVAPGVYRKSSHA